MDEPLFKHADLAHDTNWIPNAEPTLDSDRMVTGVDVMSYFMPPSTSVGLQAEASPLDRFMRNEIAYSDFIQMTASAKRARTARSAATLREGMMEGDEFEQQLKTDVTNEELNDDISLITEHERLLEEVDEDRLLGIPLELRNSESTAPETVHRIGGSSERRIKMPKALEALIGHANVIYAKGQTKEAIAMLLENVYCCCLKVIRQEPRNPEAYRQVADIYNDLNSPYKSLQYGLLAAHLNGTRTSAVQWADLGDHASKLKKTEEAAACYGRAIRADPANHAYYEKRIEALEKTDLKALAMRTRFAAAQAVDHTQVPFEWFKDIIFTVS
ncbi:unnamed protein product [Gongylonema pulchrum]|uniref:TPR_REGION domain-containing protein n=1 Tax=Gongylonema pulchrum TaxID=637853 RepID=A0A183DN41_9BILA|nr:unnamed protein product [Gongylonema pulchrum]